MYLPFVYAARMDLWVMTSAGRRLNAKEHAYLQMGLKQPGGKLPLFDDFGQEINAGVIRSCIKKGMAEQWFANPLKPEWLVCRLTKVGRLALKN